MLVGVGTDGVDGGGNLVGAGMSMGIDVVCMNACVSGLSYGVAIVACATIGIGIDGDCIEANGRGSSAGGSGRRFRVDG